MSAAIETPVRPRALRAAILACAVLLSACVPQFSYVDTRGKVTSSPLPAPEGAYDTLVWSPDGLIHAIYRQPGADSSAQLVSLDPSEGAFVEASTFADMQGAAACAGQRDEHASRLNTHQIALIVTCDQPVSQTLVAIDVVTRKTTALWPAASLPQDIVGLAARPSSTEIMAARRTPACSRLSLIDADGLHAPRMSITDDTSWQLDADWVTPDAVCGSVRDTASPAYAPDGTAFAFLASRHSVGLRGDARLAAKQSLIVINLSTRAGTLVLDEVQGGLLVWSPNSRFIAFRGTIRSTPELAGVFVVDVSTSVAYLVSGDAASGIEWAPDGRALLVAVPGDAAGGHLELLDVSEIVNRVAAR